MSEPGEIARQLASVSQLASVINAMRGIAAARTREAEAHLAAIRGYAKTIGAAIAEILRRVPASTFPASTESGGRLAIAICAEHGFTGAYDDVLIDRALNYAESPANLLLIGDRGLARAMERKVTPWRALPMAAHAGEVTGVANRIADLVYDRMAGNETWRTRIFHAQTPFPQPDARRTGTTPEPTPTTFEGSVSIVEHQLVPFDLTRFPPAANRSEPLLNLSAPTLLPRLTEEYVFAELCEALMLAYAAENAARLRAMLAAHENIGRKLAELQATNRRLRQERITSEVTELASARLAPRDA